MPSRCAAISASVSPCMFMRAASILTNSAFPFCAAPSESMRSASILRSSSLTPRAVIVSPARSAGISVASISPLGMYSAPAAISSSRLLSAAAVSGAAAGAAGATATVGAAALAASNMSKPRSFPYSSRRTLML